MRRIALALAAATLASPALAHDGPAGHAHPHGLEAAGIALVVAGLGWLAWRALSR